MQFRIAKLSLYLMCLVPFYVLIAVSGWAGTTHPVGDAATTKPTSGSQHLTERCHIAPALTSEQLASRIPPQLDEITLSFDSTGTELCVSDSNTATTIARVILAHPVNPGVPTPDATALLNVTKINSYLCSSLGNPHRSCANTDRPPIIEMFPHPTSSDILAVVQVDQRNWWETWGILFLQDGVPHHYLRIPQHGASVDEIYWLANGTLYVRDTTHQGHRTERQIKIIANDGL